MKSVFPYCDQMDCAHYDNCQSEPRIMLRVLAQTPDSIQLHDSCRNITQQMWDNYMLDITAEYLNKQKVKTA